VTVFLPLLLLAYFFMFMTCSFEWFEGSSVHSACEEMTIYQSNYDHWRWQCSVFSIIRCNLVTPISFNAWIGHDVSDYLHALFRKA